MSKAKKEMEFLWDYCGVCRGAYVICPKCGNNCCNGGYGSFDKRTGKWGTGPALGENPKDFVKCDVCPLAYQFQREAKRPAFPEKYMRSKVREHNRLMDSIFGKRMRRSGV